MVLKVLIYTLCDIICFSYPGSGHFPEIDPDSPTIELHNNTQDYNVKKSVLVQHFIKLWSMLQYVGLNFLFVWCDKSPVQCRGMRLGQTPLSEMNISTELWRLKHFWILAPIVKTKKVNLVPADAGRVGRLAVEEKSDASSFDLIISNWQHPGKRIVAKKNGWVFLPPDRTWTASLFHVVGRAGMVKTAKGAEDFCLRSGER